MGLVCWLDVVVSSSILEERTESNTKEQEGTFIGR